MTTFEKAICFAVEAHQGMQRKRESLPFIIHPLEVATICASVTSDPEVLAAAVLHDTVEDTDTTIEQIQAAFGPRVAQLVASETEDKRADLPPSLTWRIRKEESLAQLKAATDPGVKVLWLGDKLSNVRSLFRGWKVCGHTIWKDFNQKDPAQQAWYYRSLTALLQDLHGYDAWQELNEAVNTIFEGVDAYEEQA